MGIFIGKHPLFVTPMVERAAHGASAASAVPPQLLVGSSPPPTSAQLAISAGEGSAGFFRHPPSGTSAPFVLMGPGDVTGGSIPREYVRAFTEAISIYQRQTTATRICAALERGTQVGSLPFPHPVMMTLSPYGWRDHIFEALQARSLPPFHLRGRPLRMGCFGAGLHNDYGAYSASQEHALLKQIYQPETASLDEWYLRYAKKKLADSSSGDISPYSPAFDVAHFMRSESRRFRKQFPQDPFHVSEQCRILKKVCQEIFGDCGGSSYEPRYLLVRCLAGEAPGSLDVFDSNPKIGEDLQNPQLLFTNAMWPRETTAGKSFASSLAFLERTKEVQRTVHHYWWDKRNLISIRADVSDEMKKVRFHQADFVVDPFAVPEPFDFSLWMDGHYFFDTMVIPIVVAKMVHATAVGTGYFLTDCPIPELFIHRFGLEVVRDFTASGRKVVTLYRRAREERLVRELVDLAQFASAAMLL